ncbi:MAG: helix-turn-helix domain-containing protein [Oscillospiraceae bacterium]|nr:helix-turn-helix domain-containing protein [Oscillospiraceae bacterium]
MQKETTPITLKETVEMATTHAKEYNKSIKERGHLIAQRMKKLRKDKDVTQSQVCDTTGINRINYSGYENEKATPNAETLVRIADYFEVSVDYLMGRTDDPKIYFAQSDTEQSSESSEDRIANLERQLSEMQKLLAEIKNQA